MDGLQLFEVFVTQIVRGLEVLHRRMVVHVHVLQGLEAGELVIVLQDILNPQVFAKELRKRLLVRLLNDLGRIGETPLQFGNHLDVAAPSLAGGDVGETLHVFLVALFQDHVLGVGVAKEGDGIDCGLLEIAEGLVQF